MGWSQIGGKWGFQSINLTSNPRAAALGGTSISLADGDISQFFENPATLDSVNDKNLFLHLNPYFADVFVYSAAYSFNASKAGMLVAGVNYINYGEFEMTDDSGNSIGTFQAQDYTFQVGKAHRLGPFSLGANLKFSHAAIDTYSSTALLMDIGGVFRVNQHWTLGMVFENMGIVVSEYTGTIEQTIPFDVKVGTSFKPQYMPLRFTLTSMNLTQRNFEEENNTTGRSSNGLDQVMRRISLGAELLLSENFQFLIGYNHKRKQELKLDEIGGGAGLSYGFMIKIKRMEMRFSRANYHVSGGSSFISIRTDLNDFKKIL